MSEPTTPTWVNPQPTATAVPASAPAGKLWRPVGALVFSIMGLVGAVPLGLWGLAATVMGAIGSMSVWADSNGSGGAFATGVVALVSGLLVGTPMTIYLFRSRKLPFYLGIAAMVLIPVFLLGSMIVMEMTTVSMFQKVAAPR